MLLRESASEEGIEVNASAVTNLDDVAGVAHEAELASLVHALLAEPSALPSAIKAAQQVLGAQQVFDVLAVASAFNGITRVADSTGIELDASTAARTPELRRQTGIQSYAYDEKTSRYSN